MKREFLRREWMFLYSRDGTPEGTLSYDVYGYEIWGITFRSIQILMLDDGSLGL